MDIYQKSLALHQQLKGKIEIKTTMNVETRDDLSLVYSPGVAQPCREIQKDFRVIDDVTWRQNTVAVVSNGSAVLGLGNIGPEAGLPVMEGKAMLFKAFANINALPLCIRASSPEEVIAFCKALEPSVGGINLEDIKAPECVLIEEACQKELSIPVFHDDQHGTAIVVLAGLLNACKLVGKSLESLSVVVSGTGAAGSAIIKLLYASGVRHLKAFNQNGVVDKKFRDQYDAVVQGVCDCLSDEVSATYEEALVGADCFIGVSVADLLSVEWVKKMNHDAIIFAMANPSPEISYDLAKQAGVRIMGTGRSDYPNQINNVLAFPGIFRGALDAHASTINEPMKLAAAYAIASLVSDEQLSDTMIVPSVLDERVALAVAQAVAQTARETGVIQEGYSDQ